MEGLKGQGDLSPTHFPFGHKAGDLTMYSHGTEAVDSMRDTSTEQIRIIDGPKEEYKAGKVFGKVDRKLPSGDKCEFDISGK